MLRSSGMVRKLDELNRLCIPREICRSKGLQERDAIEIYTDGDQIILKKYEPGCLFCGSCEDVINYGGKNICRTCAAELGKRVG